MCDGKYTGILATLTSKKLKGGEKLSVSNHCVTPTEEELYHVASQWINHRTTLMKGGVIQLNKHKLNRVHGKAGEDNRKKKIICITVKKNKQK